MADGGERNAAYVKILHFTQRFNKNMTQGQLNASIMRTMKNPARGLLDDVEKRFNTKIPLSPTLFYQDEHIIVVSTVKPMTDKDGTPTYTVDFAKTCKSLLEREMWGLYNCVCQGETSRLEVAGELLKVLGLEGKISINEVSSDFFAKEYFAARPASERLVNKKLELMGQNIMSPWKLSLNDYVTGRFIDSV